VPGVNATAGSSIVPINDLGRDDGSMEEVLAATAVVLASGHYLMGPNVAALEEALAAEVGCSGAATVASGTDALALALAALRLAPESEVLVPANAGGYASIAARLADLLPVAADVEPTTALVSLDSLQRAATGSTRVVVATHLYGQVVPDISAIRKWCDDTGRFLVEDCAQAAGASLSGRAAGSFGHVGTFSFYPTKNLAAMGDGGAIATHDTALLERVRALAQYGWHSRYDSVLSGGRNSRMDEVQAAVLRVRLPRLGGLNERRRWIARRYRQAVEQGPLKLLGADGPHNVAHLAVLVCDDRSRVQRHLEARNIATAVHYPVPDHRQPGLGVTVGPAGAPVAEDACGRVLTVPCFPTMNDDEVSQVAAALGSYVAEGA
jgi:aminotransferase EvaB